MANIKKNGWEKQNFRSQNDGEDVVFPVIFSDAFAVFAVDHSFFGRRNDKGK